jgi:hypothetical protein
MIHGSDEARWAQEEFGGAVLGDVRRAQRLVMMATVAALRPAGKVTEVFTEAAEQEGAYRFLRSRQIDDEEMAASAHRAAARRCRGQPFAYVPGDGTSLNLTDRIGTKGFGQVGTNDFCARGLQVLTGIAVTPDGTPQGVTGQVLWCRKPRRHRRTREQRARASTKSKETQRWLDVMEQTGEAFERGAPLTRPWFQFDRAGDAWPIFLAAKKAQVWLTVRSCWDRRLVKRPGQRGAEGLRERVKREEPLGDFLLSVPAGKGRTARTATMQIRACPVTLDLRDLRTGRRHPTHVWAVSATEITAVPRRQERLHWLLLTSYPVLSLESAVAVVFGYAQRWRIEDFHRTWKSGSCRVEESQLRDFTHMVRWATILASVSLRIERLKHLARTQPDQPATVAFTQAEIDAAIILAKPKGYRRGDVPSIGEVVLWVARQGGYTGKSSGGPPGAIVISRGMRRVEVLAQVFSDGSLEI